MKKAIVSFALVLVLSMSSFAGNKEKNERREKCEFPCEQMVKDLNLSEKQLSQFKDQYIQYLEQKVARLERRADRDSWRERFRAPFMVKDMKQGRLNPLPWSEKNVEK